MPLLRFLTLLQLLDAGRRYPRAWCLSSCPQRGDCATPCGEPDASALASTSSARAELSSATRCEPTSANSRLRSASGPLPKSSTSMASGAPPLGRICWLLSFDSSARSFLTSAS
eukprot:8232926-Pyramimonas_sp.AAC.1